MFMQKNDSKNKDKILFFSIYCVNCTDIFRNQFQSICKVSSWKCCCAVSARSWERDRTDSFYEEWC